MEQRRRAVTAADGLTRLVTGYFNIPWLGMPGNEVEAAVEAIVQIGESARLPRVAVDEWGFASESTAKGAVFAQLAEGDYRFGPGRKELRGDEEEGSSRSPRAVLEQYLPYWKAHRQYVDRWDAFARQAGHALVLHPALADSVDRDSLLRQASELGIHESQANLSLLNLAEATAALSALQREIDGAGAGRTPCCYGRVVCGGANRTR